MGSIEGQGVSRRQVITWGVGSATGLFLTSKLGIVRVLGGDAAGAEEGGPARVSTRPRYRSTSRRCSCHQPCHGRGKLRVRGGKSVDYYEIAVRQHHQQVLPVGLPATTVWGYGPRVAQGGGPLVFNAPSLTIEAKWNAPGAGEVGQRAGGCRLAPTCPICSRSTRRCTGRTLPDPSTTSANRPSSPMWPGADGDPRARRQGHRRERRLRRGLVPPER